MAAKTANAEHPEVLRLASLSPLEYESERKSVAEALNVRIATLDKSVAEERARSNSSSSGRSLPFVDVDPWPHPVSAAMILDEMLLSMRRHVVADAATLHAAVLWCALTWFQHVATVMPIALITSPEKNCGKTTLLEMMRCFVRRGVPVSNISPAALFRCTDEWCPTLMIDETDTFAKDNIELRGILNAGHERGSGVMRTEEVNGEIKLRWFSTWAPKALAGIGRLPPTIQSRAIILRMRRAGPGEVPERLRHADRSPFEIVRRKLARWADDAGYEFAQLRPVFPELSNRDFDNWEVLLAMADLAGSEWPARAREAARLLSGGELNSASVNMELLGDISETFQTRAVDRLTTQSLLEALAATGDGPWATWHRGRPMTARQLSSRLAEFGIRPGTIRIGERTHKGYLLDQFAEAFASYLDPMESVTTSQRSSNAGCSDFITATGAPSVTDSNAPGALRNKPCDGVTDQQQGQWEAER